MTVAQGVALIRQSRRVQALSRTHATKGGPPSQSRTTNPATRSNCTPMTNARTGLARGTKGQPGTLAWDSDPVILDRLADVARLRAQGLNRAVIAFKLNTSVRTVAEDYARLIELGGRNAIEAVEEHLAILDVLKRRAWEMLEETDRRSMNRAALIGELLKIEMSQARLDGSLVKRTEVSGALTISDLLGDHKDARLS